MVLVDPMVLDFQAVLMVLTLQVSREDQLDQQTLCFPEVLKVR